MQLGMASSVSTDMQLYRGLNAPAPAPILVIEPDPGERSTIERALRALFAQSSRDKHDNVANAVGACESEFDQIPLVVCSTPDDGPLEMA